MMFLSDFCNVEPGYYKIGDKVLDKMVNLSTELEVKDELSLCFLYAYLIYTGNLSVNRNFRYDKNNIYNNYFYQIMLGYGCCRNIEDGLSEFLNKKDIKNHTVYVNTNPFAKNLNHCVNLIILKDGYFVFDVTNMELLKISGRFLRRINVKGLHYTKIINPKESIFDCFNLRKEQRNFKYNLDEYLNKEKYDFEFFRKNQCIFNNFYDEAKDDIKEINRLILK